MIVWLWDMLHILTFLSATAICLLITSGCVWGAFQFIGKKWIENSFSKKLDSYRIKLQGEVSKELEADRDKYAKELADKQAEYAADLEKQKNSYAEKIESLRRDLDFYAFRKTHFAEKEAEALAMCWESLMRLHRSILEFGEAGVLDFLTYRFEQQRYPNLRHMTKANLELFLADLDTLEAEDKDNILNHCSVEEREGRYISLVCMRYAHRGKRDFKDYDITLCSKGIFIPAHIHTLFKDALFLLEHIIKCIEKYNESDNPIALKEINRLMKDYRGEFKSIKEQIQLKIQGYLFPQDTGRKEKEQVAGGGEG